LEALAKLCGVEHDPELGVAEGAVTLHPVSAPRCVSLYTSSSTRASWLPMECGAPA